MQILINYKSHVSGGGGVWASDGDLTASTVPSVWCLSVSDNPRVRTFDVDWENPGAKVLSIDF